MFYKIYSFFLRLTSKPCEKGQYSAGYWQDKVRSQVIGLLRSSKGRVLEIGCGEGFFLARLAKEGPGLKLWGIDFNAERLKEAEKKFSRLESKVSLSLGDANRLSFKENSFDAVVCINVLFNVPSVALLENILKEARRVVKNSGRIIFDFRNARHPLLKIKYRLAPHYDRSLKDLPLNCYTERRIEGMLRNLGLKIINKIFINPFISKKLSAIIIVEAQK